MLFRFYIIVVFLLITSNTYGITLSEVMFNPDGNENSDEFIELYNNSLFPVNLAGWMISDGEGTDHLDSLDQGLFVLPGQYVLILDPEYISLGSTTYDGLVPENALIVTIDNSTIGSRGLSNSSPESVILMNYNGDTISIYTYSTDNLDGYSDEKIVLTGNNESANWTNSLSQHGTPGSTNSVTPPDRDYAISNFYAIPRIPEPGSIYDLSIVVKNRGFNTLLDSLYLYQFLESSDSSLSLIEIIAWQVNSISFGDSQVFHYNINAEGATQEFRASLSLTDDVSENNSFDLTVNGNDTIGTILFNEIMYSPSNNLSEWVEIVNMTSHNISLTNWSFADGNGIEDTTDRAYIANLTITPHGFAILAADSNIYMYSIPPNIPIYVWNSSLPSLNNTGDSLVLYNSLNEMVDRIDYRPSWGGDVQGISLERISLTSPTNDPINWNSSLDSSGSSPGRENSRAISQTQKDNNILILEPNPFSPNDDGKEDILSVKLNFDYADSRVDIKIFDTRGRKVKTLANNQAIGYTGEKLWDGKDDNSQILPTGLYVIYLEAYGMGSSRIQTARRAVALAKTK